MEMKDTTTIRKEHAYIHNRDSTKSSSLFLTKTVVCIYIYTTRYDLFDFSHERIYKYKIFVLAV